MLAHTAAGVDDPVTVRLPQTLRASVEQAAAQLGVCRSEYIRNAVAMAIAAEVACRQVSETAAS
jgi:metal-responsive CopG/Arc/MetJ family transcriptional regulator